jgi:hypothetical protein
LSGLWHGLLLLAAVLFVGAPSAVRLPVVVLAVLTLAVTSLIAAVSAAVTAFNPVSLACGICIIAGVVAEPFGTDR